jgi:hypothetical protein
VGREHLVTLDQPGIDIRRDRDGGERLVQGARIDRYGRTLAYLYLEPGGLFVNREIVAKGFGHAYTNYPFAYLDDFRAAEHQARERRLGLWGPDRPAAAPWAETTVYITKTGTKYHRAGCRFLAKGATPIRLAEVGTKYHPCAVCDPPRLRLSRRGLSR